MQLPKASTAYSNFAKNFATQILLNIGIHN